MPKIKGLYLYLILFLVSFIIYSNCLNGDFLFDDKALVVDNADIKNLRDIPLLFTGHIFKFSFPDYENRYNYYRPISSLLHAFIYRFSALNPLGYHLASIAVHSLNALLLFFLLYKLFSEYRLALLASLLFCVHPLQSEAVSSISSVAELLVCLFVFLTAISYIRYTETRKSLYYALSLLSFTLAFLSKEAGFLIFLPFLILIVGLKSKFPKKIALLHFVSFAGIVFIYVKLRLTILMPIQAFPKSTFPFFADLLNFFNVLAHYLKLLIAPSSFHILRTIRPVMPVDFGAFFLPALFGIILALILIISVKRKEYVLLFGASWFILGLLHLVKIMYKFRGHIVMEEHWAYFASAGFFAVLSWLILRLKKPIFIVAISGFLIFFFSGLTFLNSGHWNKELDFYRYNLRFIEPSLTIIPRLNFATALCNRKLFNEALEQIDIILALSPGNLYAYIELGDIYYTMKKFPEAKEAYRKALKIDYFCWQANRKLKFLAKESGEEFKDELDPGLSPLEAEIISLIRLGEFEDALRVLEKATINSPSPEVYTLSGITFAKIGLYQHAVDAFNDALKLDPGYSQALFNLAVIYGNRNETEKAALIWKRIKDGSKSKD